MTIFVFITLHNFICLHVICYRVGRAYCPHSLPHSEHLGEGNIQNTPPTAEHDGGSAETGCWSEGERIFRGHTAAQFEPHFLKRVPPQQ